MYRFLERFHLNELNELPPSGQFWEEFWNSQQSKTPYQKNFPCKDSFVVSRDFMKRLTNIGRLGFAAQFHPYHMVTLKVTSDDDSQLFVLYTIQYLF